MLAQNIPNEAVVDFFRPLLYQKAKLWEPQSTFMVWSVTIKKSSRKIIWRQLNEIINKFYSFAKQIIVKPTFNTVISAVFVWFLS